MQQGDPKIQAMINSIDSTKMLEQVQRWSAINSGTGNLAGLARQASLLAEAFSALPGDIRLESPEPVTVVDTEGNDTRQHFGQHMVVSVRPEASRRILLTGHMDTVFAEDHPFQAQIWLDEQTLNGPGVADMKGGLAIILHALLAFERSNHARNIGYDVMINSDEETGSLSSAALIASLAHGKFAALTYEPSTLPDGTLAHARGGSGNYSIVFQGRSAHAGRNPQDGRNALVAAADCAMRLKEMEDAQITINPARIDGGSANNVVPDKAILRFNIRPKTTGAAESFTRKFEALLGEIEAGHDLSARCLGGVTRPPKPVDARAQKLFDLVKECGAELGQEIAWKSTGGVCDGNNIAACGVPVVDTMGVRGGAIHSGDEFLIVPSLLERAALSCLVLDRLAKGESL
ncbi:MAG: hydrolase [Sphingomonadaceae bacterium]